MNDASQIVARQRAYFATGATLPLSFRKQALDALRASILRHEADINAALMQDLGKSASETYMCETGMTLSELRYRVAPHGRIGRYLFEQMAEFNARVGAARGSWPHGEGWCLGDQPTVGLLLEDRERDNYDMVPAPRIAPDFSYQPLEGSREIRVYHTIDARMILEDFYCKLALFAMDKEESIHE